MRTRYAFGSRGSCLSRRACITGLALFGIVLSACSSGGDATGPVITSVAINPSSLTLNGVGQTGLLVAAVLDARGNQVSNATITWASENTSVATITGAGSSATVTAVSNGTATMRATSGTVSGTVIVTVNARVLRVTVSPGNLTLRVGEAGALTANVESDPGVSTTYTWETSAAAVATVSVTGQVAATGRGTATITARATADPTKSAAALVAVIGVGSVTVSPKPVTIDRGSTQQMSATVLADAGISNAVTWRSTNVLAVSVNSTGLITAVNPGLAYVVATATAEPAKRDSSLMTVPDACLAPQAYTLGSTVNGSLTIADCNGGRLDYYTYSTSNATRFSVTLSPATDNMDLAPFVGEAGWGWVAIAGTATPRYMLASAGSHRLSVSVFDTTKRGSYTLSSTVNPVFPSTCPTVIATLAVSWSFALSNTCPGYLPSGLSGTFYSQAFLVDVPANKSFRVTVVAAAYQARIELKKVPDNTLLASAFAPAAGAPAVLVFTPSSPTGGTLIVTSQTAGAVGNFTITIDP